MGPWLPISRSFVVQYSKDADLRRRRVSGRIEHVPPGRSGRFASQAKLDAFVIQFFRAVMGEATSVRTVTNRRVGTRAEWMFGAMGSGRRIGAVLLTAFARGSSIAFIPGSVELAP